MIARLGEDQTLLISGAHGVVNGSEGELPAIVRQELQVPFSQKTAFSPRRVGGFANWQCLLGVAVVTLISAAIQFGVQRPDPCAGDLAKLAAQHGVSGFVSPAADNDLRVHVPAGKQVDVCLISSDGRLGPPYGDTGPTQKVTNKGENYEHQPMEWDAFVNVRSPDPDGAHYQAVAFLDGQPTPIHKQPGLYDAVATPEVARAVLAEYGVNTLFRTALEQQPADVLQPIARFVLAWQAAGLPQLDARTLDPLHHITGSSEGVLRHALSVLADKDLVALVQPNTQELIDFALARQKYSSGNRLAELKTHFQTLKRDLGYTPRLSDAQALYNMGEGSAAGLEQFLVKLRTASGGQWSPSSVQDKAPIEWLRTHVPWTGTRVIKVGNEEIQVSGPAFLEATSILAKRYGLHDPTAHLATLAVLSGEDGNRSRRLSDLLGLVQPKTGAESQALAEMSLQPLSRYFSDQQVLARAKAEQAKGRSITAASLAQIAQAMAREPAV